MGKFWSLLFLAVPVLGTLCYLAGMLMSTGPLAHWFPENVNSMAHEIDHLHDLILALIGVVFVATGVALFWFMWRYDDASNPDPAKFVHGNHKLEFWWTAIPTVILLGLAVYQLQVWSDVKIRRPMLAGPDGQLGTSDDTQQPASYEVVGRQFEWRFRYAGQDGLLDTPDDVLGDVNELHVPVDETIVATLKAADVLHSFFVPALRLKNDIVPGTQQVVWFRAEKIGSYEIVCAELCGWGHYKMKGRLVVDSREDYAAYMEALRSKQFQRSYSDDSEAERLAESAKTGRKAGSSPDGTGDVAGSADKTAAELSTADLAGGAQ